jgi:hypothetical protein
LFARERFLDLNLHSLAIDQRHTLDEPRVDILRVSNVDDAAPLG